MVSEHEQAVQRNVQALGADTRLQALTQQWLLAAIGHNYAHNFSWLGRPVIQVPQDIYATQEILWRVQPDLVIETGIAHGGSLILSASMLAMMDYCDAARAGTTLTPGQSRRKVIGIDIDIRAHNRAAVEGHPLASLIEMHQGSSIDPDIVHKVREAAARHQRVLVFLDSNHTHDHVLAELQAYAPLVSPGSYCVVWDTGVEDLPEGFVTNRPWGKGNNPKTAVFEYLRQLRETSCSDALGQRVAFEFDKTIEHKIAISASPDGFLRRCDAEVRHA
jgi:cephalosporin hydroxylase